MGKYIENVRFRRAVNLLIENNIVKNKSAFAKGIGKHAQIIYDIYKDKLRVSSEILDRSQSIYGVSKKYVLLGEGEILDPRRYTTVQMAGNPYVSYEVIEKDPNAETQDPVQTDKTNDPDDNIAKLIDIIRMKDEQIERLLVMIERLAK